MSHVVVLGAGVAGLLAAHVLADAGHAVTVLDKGLVPGGRLATRTVGAATFDHGAQFFTVRDERFAARVRAWETAGVSGVAFRGSPDVDEPHGDARDGDDPGQRAGDGHPRYRGRPTMRAVAEHLARGLTLRLGVEAESVGLGPGGGWDVRVHDRLDPTDTGHVLGDALLLTPPLPQTLALLDAGHVPLETGVRDHLGAIGYEPCIAVLAVPAGPTRLPASGVLRLPGDPLVWLTDNQRTGASSHPAVTVHADPAFSRARWADPDAEVARDLLAAARAHLGVDAAPVYVHHWRYARPVGPSGPPTLLDRPWRRPVAFAGDGLTGGRVEGAAVSGLAAADALLAELDGHGRPAGS